MARGASSGVQLGDPLGEARTLETFGITGQVLLDRFALRAALTQLAQSTNLSRQRFRRQRAGVAQVDVKGGERAARVAEIEVELADRGKHRVRLSADRV